MKLRSFYCDRCEEKFEDKGIREERMDAVFGASWRMVAHCPTCERKVGELKEILRARNDPQSSGESSTASCPTGTCPFMTN